MHLHGEMSASSMFSSSRNELLRLLSFCFCTLTVPSTSGTYVKKREDPGMGGVPSKVQKS